MYVLLCMKKHGLASEGMSNPPEHNDFEKMLFAKQDVKYQGQNRRYLQFVNIDLYISHIDNP